MNGKRGRLDRRAFLKTGAIGAPAAIPQRLKAVPGARRSHHSAAARRLAWGPGSASARATTSASSPGTAPRWNGRRVFHVGSGGVQLQR